ncbi:MAG: sporulation protein YtfJ [Clostridia bacterium]|nr:sporulation protein YtfJ [Clostridia bacterium]MBR5753236.1 sporulation protein YtfJ [Clostridia bacterium]
MSKDNSAANLLQTTFDKVKDNIDVSTVIGDPVYTESGMTIIPISKVTYGFATGGDDFPTSGGKEMFGGCGGAGVTITPVAFMLIQDGEVTIKHISGSDSAAEKMVNLVPDMFDKVSGFMNRSKD